MSSPIKAHLARENVKIYHEVYGDEKKPTLLLSHAYGASHKMWQKQIEPFSKKYRLILWDMRGHGLTETETQPDHFSHTLTIEDMSALLDHYNAKPAIIGGLSLGGYMSLVFYHHYPQYVKTLILCDTGPGFRKDESRTKWNNNAERQAEILEKRGLGAAPKVPIGVQHHSVIGLALAARHILTQHDALIINRLEQVQIPTLIVVGADDKPFHPSADYMERKIPLAEKIVIPNAEHYVNDDNPETFNHAVLDYLDGLSK